MNKQQQARTLAKKYAIDVEWDGRGGSIWVYPADGQFSNDQDDPYYDDHACDDWAEALRRVCVYVNRMFPGGPATSSAPPDLELQHLAAPFALAASACGRPITRSDGMGIRRLDFHTAAPKERRTSIRLGPAHKKRTPKP